MREHSHSHSDPRNWDIAPQFEDEPAKGKSKVYCRVCAAFIGMKPGAAVFAKSDFRRWLEEE